MKKITFNAPLNHKAYSYEPMKIEVEKVITLYGKRFEQMRDHPLEDAPEIIENRDLMYMEGGTAHCILFLDANGNDGILVEAEGADYARKSEFISNARAIVEANDITAGEQQLHQEMKKMADKIAGLAHRGEHHIYFGNLHESEIIKSLIVKSVAEMLSQRSDIADVKNHYPMQTSRSKTKPHYTFTDSSIPVMLRSTKALLSHKQYKNLCIAVNEAEGYHEKKKVIFRCIEPVIRK